MAATEINTKYKVGQKTRLNGYTSTSLHRSLALSFTVDDEIIDPMKFPVLMQIEFKGTKQFFHLNTNDYSAYPDENEVLIQDGIEYEIVKIDVVPETIPIQYPTKKSIKRDITIIHLKNIPDMFSKMSFLKQSFYYLFK